MRIQLDSLQVYRGFAALLVVAHHSNIIFQGEISRSSLLSIFSFGWVGVDFFFVLSGFIIFYIHQSDIGRKSNFMSFILKRFIRVYPLYWVILICKIFASLISSHAVSAYEPFEFIKSFLLLPQDRVILESPSLESQSIGVSWTLRYEIFFYFLFSLSLLLKPRVLIPIAIVWVVGIFLNLVEILNIPEQSFWVQFVFYERNLEFVFGCLAAYIVSKYEIFHGKLLCCVSVCLLAVAITNTKDSEFNAAGVSPVIAYGIPFMLLIIGSVFLEKRKSLNTPKALVYIGTASYSIYLTHGFFIGNLTKLTSKLISKFDLIWVTSNVFTLNMIALVIVALAVCFGCIVSALIERPLIAVLRRSLPLKVS